MSIEPILSPIILNVWAQHVSDPFISIDAVEVLEVSIWFNCDAKAMNRVPLKYFDWYNCSENLQR